MVQVSEKFLNAYNIFNAKPSRAAHFIMQQDTGNQLPFEQSIYKP